MSRPRIALVGKGIMAHVHDPETIMKLRRSYVTKEYVRFLEVYVRTIGFYRKVEHRDSGNFKVVPRTVEEKTKD